MSSSSSSSSSLWSSSVSPSLPSPPSPPSPSPSSPSPLPWSSPSGNRILFGSCNSQHYEQTLWPAIRSRKAAAFVWAGDAIYADDFENADGEEEDDADADLAAAATAASVTNATDDGGGGGAGDGSAADSDAERKKKTAETGEEKEKKAKKRKWNPFAWLMPPRLKVKEATPEIVRDLYERQLSDPGYRSLLDDGVAILGVMDDHDYGANNGDVTYPHRTETGVAYVDFLEGRSAPRDEDDAHEDGGDDGGSSLRLMARRAAAGHGVYGVKVFDFARPKGRELLTDEESGLDPDLDLDGDYDEDGRVKLSEKSVAIFLLDCRSNKTPWKRGDEKYDLDYEADFLGERQWSWFEAALSRSSASVNVVVQGLQVHADRFFDGNEVEAWSRFPMSQHRLYQAVLRSGARSPVLVSGDVHMAELTRKDCRRRGGGGGDETTRMLLEVTTSGMTHSWGSRVCARPNSSASCRNSYIDWSLAGGMHFVHHNYAWTDVVDIRDPDLVLDGARRGPQYALKLNFAEFDFDWDNRRLVVRFLGQDVDSPPYVSTAWDFDLLSGTVPPPGEGSSVRPSDYDDVRDELVPHGASRDDDWYCVAYRRPQTPALKLYGFLSACAAAGFLMMLPLVLPAVVAFIIMRPSSRRSSSHKKKCSV